MTSNRILIAYATRHGQARKVADHLARELTLWGWPVIVADVARTPAIDWPDYSAAILVASVYAGHHEKEMIAFVRRGHAALDQMPNAFLSVMLAEATAEDRNVSESRRTEAALAVKKVIDAFVEDTGWHPRQVLPVAGALLYRQYNFFIRFIMKRITKKQEGPTDTSRDYEYTDWAALSRFASTFSRSLAQPTKTA
ncbi:MAG: flavodoxin domain-containing protein [Vicinamibacterales bacterium]